MKPKLFYVFLALSMVLMAVAFSVTAQREVQDERIFFLAFAVLASIAASLSLLYVVRKWQHAELPRKPAFTTWCLLAVLGASLYLLRLK